MTGLRALRDLYFHHFDLRMADDILKVSFRKISGLVAAAEVGRSKLKDNVAAALVVIRADSALTGVKITFA